MEDDKPLDGREEVELNLPKEELFNLMLLAHEEDLTLNNYVEKLLRKAIDTHVVINSNDVQKDEKAES